MRKTDARALLAFNEHMGMFIHPQNRNAIIAFINGYEYGAHGKCNFAQSFSSHLEHQHKLRYDELGWPGQVERLAERNNTSWKRAYLLASTELLRRLANSIR